MSYPYFQPLFNNSMQLFSTIFLYTELYIFIFYLVGSWIVDKLLFKVFFEVFFEFDIIVHNVHSSSSFKLFIVDEEGDTTEKHYECHFFRKRL